jgi:methylthioribose-1-phosphate isomerase
MRVAGTHHRTVRMEGGTVVLIDQPALPHTFRLAHCKTHQETAEAIRTMVVRGAGAIGATGAFGVAQAALEARDEHFELDLRAGAGLLRATRPTAQNLFFGVDTVLTAALSGATPAEARSRAVAAAQAVADDDAACCAAIGEHGAALLRDGMRINTHCNAGWLAFVDWGSALSPIYAAARSGKKLFVYADETRPRGQGAQLTAWELQGEGIPCAVIADNATGWLMKRGEIDLVIVGSDRIAANGDVANKIGTYSSAVMAARHGIPFYVAAPTTTIDPNCPDGEHIPIEERSADEVHWTFGRDPAGNANRVRTTPDGVSARNPAFDVTPAELIAGIITERGIIPASPEGVRSVARLA